MTVGLLSHLGGRYGTHRCRIVVDLPVSRPNRSSMPANWSMPRRYAVGLRGAAISSPQRRLETMQFVRFNIGRKSK